MYLTIKNCLSIYIVYFYVYRLVLPKRPREWTLLLTKFVKTKNQTLIIDILQPKIYQLKYFLCNFDGNHIHTLMTPFAASLCQLMIPLPLYMASRYNCKVASVQICIGRRGSFCFGLHLLSRTGDSISTTEIKETVSLLERDICSLSE